MYKQREAIFAGRNNKCQAPVRMLKENDNEEETYWVLRVKAAEVMEEGRLRPLMISCHCFLLMTSTRPPRKVTRLYNS